MGYATIIVASRERSGQHGSPRSIRLLRPICRRFLDRDHDLPGVPPLVLFTTLARDARLFERFRGGGLVDKGHLTLRQREIVIGCVTAPACPK